MIKNLAGFLGDPTHLQLAMFCFVVAGILVATDVFSIMRRGRPAAFQFEAALACVVGVAQLYLASV